MTNITKNFALLALICAALTCVAAAIPGMPADPQNAASQGSVSNLEEYACKKGTLHKGTRAGLVSQVMQRGADSQSTRVFGVKDSKTGEVAFLYVLDSDCSGEPPSVPQGGASLALAHKISGEEYFYAISPQGECMRAFQIKFLGQFVAVDTSTRMSDCQKELRIWSGQAAKWKTQASSASNSKP